jgi:hypothetical protein
MKRKLLALSVMILMAFGGTAAVGAADHEGPGPNGSNDHGLCTAYFNGQKNGHDKQKDGDGEYPGPFAGLEDHARDYTDSDNVDNDGDGEVDEENENADLSAAENIFNFCDDTSTIGGNPAHGRFTCSDDPETNGNDECTDNDAPGNS